MKKLVKNNVKVLPNDDNPIITTPQIDKLSGVVDLHDEHLCGQAFAGMLDWIKYNEDGVTKVSVAGKYQLAVKIHYPITYEGLVHNHSPFLLLQITHPKLSKRQLRMEYNPSYMTAAGEDYLSHKLTELLGVTFYELLYHARFTRVDFCRNILWRDLEDYLIHAKWAKAALAYAADGKLSSITLGKSGSTQIQGYNKAQQLYGDAADHATIRIEARCRINLNIHGLAVYENPFNRVTIFSVGCKKPPCSVGYWRAFQDSCRLRGVGNAIKRQPVSERSKFKKALSQLPVEWWAIEVDDWKWLLTDALDNAGLLQIPDSAPPLRLSYLTGCAA